MKNSFESITNSWLFRAGKAIGDVVIISVLFLLFCLPFVTIGASASALYYTVYRKYRKNADDITKDFIKALKCNLKNGIIVHLIYSAYTALVSFNIYFSFFGFKGVALPEWYKVIAFITLLPLFLSVPFLYPLIARFSNSVKETVKNSFTLCMINFPKIILIWLIIIAAVAISIAFPPAALLTPVGATYLIQMFTEKAFGNAIRTADEREGTNEANAEAATEDKVEVESESEGEGEPHE